MALPVDILPKVVTAITLLGQGRTLTHACDEAGVSVSSVRNYCQANPELAEAFNDAEQRGYDRMADTLLTIDSDPMYGNSDPRTMKIISDNIKWYLSRKRPAQYGERITVETTITADKAIIDALERGRQRAISGKVVEDVAYEVIQDVALPSPVIDVDAVDEELLQFV